MAQSNCRNGSKITYVWDSADFCWSDASVRNKVFCWDDVNFVLGNAGGLINNFETVERHKRERFITLVCKVKGYPETETMKRKVEAELTVEDIKITIDEVINSVKVKVK